MSTTTITLTVELEPNVSRTEANIIAGLLEGQEHVYRVHVHEKRAKRRKQSAMRPHVKELYDRLRIGHFFIHELRRNVDKMDDTPIRVPVGCIALGYDPENNTMRVALSVCNEADHFTKVKARDKARGRLLSWKLNDWMQFDGAEDLVDVMEQIRSKGTRHHQLNYSDISKQLQHTWDLLVTKKA